ncbi:testis-expressed protein 12 isoform X1 [Aquarana catesbeiana]|uniref:testis-expressed protein 12 isoform X1 n=2 Tax=Aquarana catesbeiana TaxID=8400 RepID=UPI003CC9E654
MPNLTVDELLHSNNKARMYRCFSQNVQLPTRDTGIVSPSAFHLFPGVMANTACEDERKSCKRRRIMEVPDSEMLQYALPTNQPSSDLDIYQGEDFELLKDVSNEINHLFSNYAKSLSEQSALDVLFVEEFDEILKEFKSVETVLKQKRESLKSRLTMIADTLQMQTIN